MADFETEIPQRIEECIGQRSELGGGFSPGDLILVEEHDIDVAKRIQFRPAVAANRDE
jgi:hypothetical protein